MTICRPPIGTPCPKYYIHWSNDEKHEKRFFLLIDKSEPLVEPRPPRNVLSAVMTSLITVKIINITKQ